MPAYAAVVELDRKIRKVCADCGVGLPGQSTTFSGLDESDAMRNYMKLVYRESSEWLSPHEHSLANFPGSTAVSASCIFCEGGCFESFGSAAYQIWTLSFGSIRLRNDSRASSG
jgi:hypothetical protein